MEARFSSTKSEKLPSETQIALLRVLQSMSLSVSAALVESALTLG